MGALFDVTTVREEERYAYWHELVCRYFCRVESKRMGESFSNASLGLNQLGCLGISELRCESMRYERSAGFLSSDPSDDFLVSLLLEGEANLSQSERYTKQKPGDVVLYDSARGFEYEFLTPYRIILLRIPRRALLTRFPDAERVTSMAMSSASQMGGLVANMMHQASAVEVPGDTPAAARVGASIIDVLSAALETELAGRDTSCDRHSMLLRRAKDYITAHMDDPDLNVESVASAIAVSPRTLNRLFATEGTPVMRWLWKERLEHSHEMLSEGRASQVTEVAFSLGFKSVSHFSRTFKEAYGVTPNMLLRSRPNA